VEKEEKEELIARSKVRPINKTKPMLAEIKRGI